MLVATLLSSSLVAGVGAGVVPAAAATPERTGRVPRAADAPSGNVTKDVTRDKPTARPQRRLGGARTQDTFRYQLRVGRRGGYASASGTVEMSDTAATNRGTLIDGGKGTATLEFGLVKADPPSEIKTIKADDERTPSDWDLGAKLTQVRIRLCKVVDPADPSKSICKQVNHPKLPEQ